VPPSPQTNLAQADIERGLRELGLHAGAGVMVHSSLRSFGRVEGGAATVIAALMTVLTPAGTLLLPTFNHGLPFEPDGPGVFDPQVTPTINGAIPEAFWRMSGVKRSLDPTHPFAAWGANAERYTANHHRTLTMGPQSPLGLLLADDGYGLLLGVDYTYNTFHHCVETTLNTPCLGKRSEAYPVRMPDGQVVPGRTWGWRNAACPFTDNNRYGRLMRERGLDHVKKIGACVATCFRLRDCFEVIAEVLRAGMDGYPPCSGCAIRPRVVAATVESDWDETLLRPRSIRTR
jgi:aminoglycoside 3-N-acetyltransferase